MANFSVNGFDPISCEYITGDSYNRVDAAIHEWFYLNEKYPSCISINTNHPYDTFKIYEWSFNNQNKIKKWHEKYNCRYKLEWLLEQIISKFNRGYTEDGFPKYDGKFVEDQVFPFCLG